MPLWNHHSPASIKMRHFGRRRQRMHAFDTTADRTCRRWNFMYDFCKFEKCRNYTNSKMAREMQQYLPPENESGADRELRFIAVDRRNPHLKRINISPFHNHVEICIFHLFQQVKNCIFKIQSAVCSMSVTSN